MPWLAVPHADVKRRSALSEFFEVEGIPSFAMIAPDLSVINRSARGAVGSDPDGSNFPWHPKLVTDVDEDLDEGINDTPTVLVLMEEAGDRWDDVNAALDRVAGDVRAGEKERGEERQVLFMTVTETGGGIGAQIRKMLKLGRPGAKPQMVLLDIANGGYVKPAAEEVSAETIATLVGDFTAGKLELTSLG